MNVNNKFDEIYEIRLATNNDITDIMSFIDQHWKNGHIMATNRAFFEYEFLEDDGRVNFIIAISRQTQTIEGILGFLYSSMLEGMRDVWGSIWKVKPGTMGMLGLELRKRMEILSKSRYAIGIGSNPYTTIPIIRKALGRKTGEMKHFYMLSDRDMSDYKIAKIFYVPPMQLSENEEKTEIIPIYDIEQLKSFFELEVRLQDIPFKDSKYVQKRFFNHPIYEYRIYGLRSLGSEQIEAVVVCREQAYSGEKVLRVVDYIGARWLMSFTGDFWRKKLEDEGYEYIDFYCYGFEEEFLFKAGFNVIKENDTNVIPNYFSPFVAENIKIYVHVPMDEILICKADGDQDRPN